MYRLLILLIVLAATVSAATIEIDVGEDGSLKYNPASTTAAVGDVLEFHFYSGSGGHSVVESSFESPCVPSASTFFSGFIPGDDSGNTVFRKTVTSTDPIWFYCALANHCQSGMVGVVNPPAGKSISDYMAAAQGVAAASAPAASTGGTLTTIMSSSTSAGAASMTSTSMSGSMSATRGSTTGSAASTTSSKASATSSSASAASSSASTRSSKASAASSSSSAVATVTASGAAGKSEVSTPLGLAVVVGGLVALMAQGVRDNLI